MASALASVSSSCFIPAKHCVNCERKNYDTYKEKEEEDIPFKEANVHAETRQVFKRCSGCWLVAYCDETCQKEHWNLVHKYHCNYLSAKEVFDKHSDSSCEDCIAQKTASKDELNDINSPHTVCKFKEESNRMKKELGKLFGFHGYEGHCNCGNQFACEHPFPVGKIQGSAIAMGMDEMIVHAAKLCSAFIVKSMNAKEKKNTITQLFDLHKSILNARVVLWQNVLVCGNLLTSDRIRDNIKFSQSKVEDKLDHENPWWKSLKFSIDCIRQLVGYQISNMELINISVTSAELSRKAEFYQQHIKNVAIISENKLWHRLKMWPSKTNTSLVLLLPDNVFCVSCTSDLSGLVVGLVDTWDPSNPSPTLFTEVANNGGIAATCSPVQSNCGKDYLVNYNASRKLSEEEKKEYRALLESTRNCHQCLKLSLSSHRCKKCHATQYCSMDCAYLDFPFHKTVCSTWAQDSNKKLMSSGDQKDVSKKLASEMSI